jgi:hypothetical protein
MFRIGLIMLVAGLVLAACTSQPALTAEVTQPAGDATRLVQPTATAALAATVSPGSSGVEPTASAARIPAAPRLQEYPLPAGSHPHDVAPAADGTVANHLRSSHFPAPAQPYGSFWAGRGRSGEQSRLPISWWCFGQVRPKIENRNRAVFGHAQDRAV